MVCFGGPLVYEEGVGTSLGQGLGDSSSVPVGFGLLAVSLFRGYSQGNREVGFSAGVLEVRRSDFRGPEDGLVQGLRYSCQGCAV